MKKRLIIIMLSCTALVLLLTGSLVVKRMVDYNSINCEEIYRKSSEFEARGIVIDFTPEVLDKCY